MTREELIDFLNDWLRGIGGGGDAPDLLDWLDRHGLEITPKPDGPSDG